MLFRSKPPTGVASASTSKPQLVQGVYVLQTDPKNRSRQRVNFVPVTTGVTGATDIEVLSGLKEGDEIVTGRYKILRALKSGTLVKKDNSVESADTDKS